MTLLSLVRRLARGDVRLILRDRMMVLLLAMAVIMGVASRLVLPVIDVALAESGTLPGEASPLRFADTFPMFVAFIGLWQAALMPGTVFGFLLLDEKEDDTLTVMQVTPVPLSRYLAHRVALPSVLAWIFGLGLLALLEPLLVGAGGPLGWGARALIVVGAAPVAPLTALFLATFAANKVQGLAFTKFTGIAGLLILVGWFVPPPWQWALGVFPPFLVAKAYWLALAGDALWPAALALGLALEVAALVWLVRRFRENAAR